MVFFYPYYRSCALRHIPKIDGFLRRNKIMAVEGGIVSHYLTVVTGKFIDFMSLFRHIVCFAFSF